MSTINVHFNQVSEGMTLLDMEEIRMMVLMIKTVRDNGGVIYTFGNGGSHSTASHFANDLLKMARVKAVCIGDMQTAMLAYGNDDGWVDMFKNPLVGLMKQKDGVIGISCSGKSANVISALGVAVAEGILAVGLTGISNDSEINHLNLNALVHVPVPDIRVQEDIHLMVCHAVVRELQRV